MAELISIIIPNYNKQQFIRKCLQSVLNQTYPNTEVIIIDDCSTDNSYDICKQVAETDSRIRLYRNEENIGHLRTRYIGIQKSKSNWITFVDADDWLENDAISRLYDNAIDLDVDMVQMRHQRRMKGVAVKYYETFDSQICGRKICSDEFYNLISYVGMDSHLSPSCWGKLYKTEILKEADRLNFNQFWGEDQIFNINYLRKARSLAIIDYIGYNYRWGGETSNYKFTMLEEYKNVHNMKRLMGQNIDCLNREIIILLRYHIRQLITELGWTPKAISSIMQDEIKDRIWERAGLEESIDDIIEQEYEDVQKSHIKYIVKRLLK